MITLKYNIRVFIKSVFFTTFALLFFIGFGYSFLTSEISLAEVKEEEIPYYSYTPQNVNILFSVLDYKTLLCFDFEKENIRIYNIDYENESYEFYGNETDFFVDCNLKALSYIVDGIGGVELSLTEETLNYTGTQIKEILEYNTDIKINHMILKDIIYKISLNGLLKEDFLLIIENCDTNLTVPDCYDWEKYIAKLCKNAVFVNY